MPKNISKITVGVIVTRHVPSIFWRSTGDALEWRCSCGAVNRSMLRSVSDPSPFVCSANNGDLDTDYE